MQSMAIFLSEVIYEGSKSIRKSLLKILIFEYSPAQIMESCMLWIHQLMKSDFFRLKKSRDRFSFKLKTQG